MPSSHLILCRPLLLLPSIFPSIRVFSSESALRMRWPKYWSFSFSISPSREHPGLISFRMDWLDLLAVQGTLKSLLQHHSLNESILRCSAFFIVQLSHPYMTPGKTIALTRQTFVDKVMSLLSNMQSRLAITFLPRRCGRGCLTMVAPMVESGGLSLVRAAQPSPRLEPHAALSSSRSRCPGSGPCWVPVCLPAGRMAQPPLASSACTAHRKDPLPICLLLFAGSCVACRGPTCHWEHLGRLWAHAVCGIAGR